MTGSGNKEGDPTTFRIALKRHTGQKIRDHYKRAIVSGKIKSKPSYKVLAAGREFLKP